MRAYSHDGDRKLRKRSSALHHIRDGQSLRDGRRINLRSGSEIGSQYTLLGRPKKKANDFRYPIRRVPHEAVVDDVSP